MFITSEQTWKNRVENPQCMGMRIFDERLIGVEMIKIETLLLEPFSVGFTVLDLAKLHMCRFLSDYFKMVPCGEEALRTQLAQVLG